MNIEIGKAYHILGKLKGMKKYQGVGGGYLQSNIMYYSIFEIKDDTTKDNLVKKVEDLNSSNNESSFKIRLIKGWEVK